MTADMTGGKLSDAARQLLEDYVRELRILLAELHRALLDQRQTEQRDLLVRDDRAALARPVHIAPAALDEVRGLLLDPCRLDARAEHSVDFLQIENLSRKNPLRRRLRNRGARKDREAALARTAIRAALGLDADLCRPSGQETAMNRLVRLRTQALAILQALFNNYIRPDLFA